MRAPTPTFTAVPGDGGIAHRCLFRSAWAALHARLQARGFRDPMHPAGAQIATDIPKAKRANRGNRARSAATASCQPLRRGRRTFRPSRDRPRWSSSSGASALAKTLPGRHLVPIQVPRRHVPPPRAGMLAGLYSYTFTLTGGDAGPSALARPDPQPGGSLGLQPAPGGGAVGLAATYAMCCSWGSPTAPPSTMAIVTGVWKRPLPDRPAGRRDRRPLVGQRPVAGPCGMLPGGMITGAIIIGVLVAVIASERQAQRGRFSTGCRPLFRRSKRTATMSVDQLVRELRARITDTVRTGWLQMTSGCRLLRPYYALFVLIMRDVGAALPLGNALRGIRHRSVAHRGRHHAGRLGRHRVGDGHCPRRLGAPPAQATAGVVLFPSSRTSWRCRSAVWGGWPERHRSAPDNFV